MGTKRNKRLQAIERNYPPGTVAVTKFDAGKRQLIAALKLHFDEGDDLAVHTLAFAALEVLSVLARKAKGREPIKDQLHILAGAERRADFQTLFSECAIFLKHGASDLQATLHFNSALNHTMLLLACDAFSLISSERIKEIDIFLMWEANQRPENFVQTNVPRAKWPDSRSAFFEFASLIYENVRKNHRPQ
jgi:hypothetical protein